MRTGLPARMGVAMALAWWLALMAPAAAQVEVSVGELRRPPTEFLEHGDVVGMSAALVEKLGIVEDEPVEVITPTGRSAGFRVKVHGDRPNALYAKKTLRDVLGVSDGALLLRVRPVAWGKGPEAPAKLAFTKVSRPPVAFLDYGEAVGVSLETIRKVNGYPGMPGKVAGPGGSKDVVVELLDRGEGVISMRGSLRQAIGVGDGDAKVELEVVPGGEAPELKPLYWYKSLKSAIGAAREDYRPLLVVASGTDAGSAELARLLEHRAAHGRLLRTRKYRFTPEGDPSSAAYFRVATTPVVILLSPDGKELWRHDGVPSLERLVAQIDGAVAQVKRPAEGATED